MTTPVLERTSSALLREREQSRAEPAVQARVNETNATHENRHLFAFGRSPPIPSIEQSLASLAQAAVDQSWLLSSAPFALTRTFGACTFFDSFAEAAEAELTSLDEATLQEIRKEAKDAAAAGVAAVTTEMERFRSASHRAKEVLEELRSRRARRDESNKR